MTRWLSLLAVGSLVACSSYEQAPPTGKTEQPITGGCSVGTVGLPCDPDDGGSLKECDGICAIVSTSGGLTVGCRRLSDVGLTNNDGKICGSSGASDCSKYCMGSTCVSGSAPDGAACRPAATTGTDICDGQCKVGVCVALLDIEKCPDNKIGDCTYDFCDAKKSTTCTKYNLPKGVSCSDMNPCTTTDVCDGAGKCGGTMRTCPATTAKCRVAACDSATGMCSDKLAASGAACVFDKCFAGTCDATGNCIKGTAVSCDDGDACTTDTCDATAGCQHTPIVGCGVDAGPTDTGFVDSGTTTDTGVVVTDTGTTTTDTGTTTTDTGTTTTDTGTATTDTGTTTTDTGTTTTDTGSSTTEDTGTSTTEDTGTSTTEDTGTTSGSDADLAETGDDAALGIEQTVEASGCGCRTTSSSPGYGALSLAALGLIAARRRRGLRR
jgi:MYXO-CTERM domain-containing protein